MHLQRRRPSRISLSSTTRIIISHVLFIFLYPRTLIHGDQDPWSFIVLSDWHNAENYALRPQVDSSPSAQLKIPVVQYIKRTHGGDLILIPGDVNVGHWDSPSFVSKFKRMYGGDNWTVPQIVEQAGVHCYTGTMQTFSAGGYDTILMAVGDHELGDNPWLASSSHSEMLTHYRLGFQRVFNRNASTGEFIYNEPIGTIPSRPHGTVFENTSYAYRFKNVLFVTLDVFDLVSSTPTDNYLNRSTGSGGEGIIIGNVQGAHLAWFESVLQEARKDRFIRHILVQGHLPVLQPVRKINSSAISIHLAEDSDFFKTMQRYHVDLYFAGEVHTNTVIQDPTSKLLQVVSRGNGFNNYMVVHVTDTQLDMTLYNEIGTQPRFNQQYEWFGSLTLDKSQGYSKVKSKGQLEILDREAPLLYFDFEEIIPLGKRVVLGLEHDFVHETLTQSQMTVRNVVCKEALMNHGSFGQQYDAQISLDLVESGSLGTFGKVGQFTGESRMAVWGMGPASGGHIISYACWFKTFALKNMVLIQYGETFANIKGMALYNSGKDIFTLSLQEGVPYVYRNFHSKIYASDKGDYYQNLADGKFHHIAISMPKKSCLFSEVQMYVNGVKVTTVLDGIDDHLFLTSSGKISVGGYGSSGAAYDTDFALDPWEGWIDEVYVWGRSLNQTDLSHLLLRSTPVETTMLKNLRQNQMDEQVNDDIHLTVMILFIGLLFFIACVRYQRSQYIRLDNELHVH